MIHLRPYQIECVYRIFQKWLLCRSVLAVLATGAGKTVIFSEVARRVRGRVLVVAHREELVMQARDKLEAVCGERVDVEMADYYAGEGFRPARIVVASVQTLRSDRRRERFRPDAFEVVIIDEAHHAPASSYTALVEYFSGAKILGVTATPKRLDKLALGQVFDAAAFDYGIEPAINDGWLVPVCQQAVKVDGLDFSGVKKAVSGDLSEADLELVLMAERVLHAMAVPTLDIVGDRPTLIFCASVSHAERMAEVLDRYKKGCARALSGKSDKRTRADVVKAYKDGSIQILCNCSLFLEGFDAPHTACVVMGRPTNSAALYCQILGRATRPLAGVVDGLDGMYPPTYLGLVKACAESPSDEASVCALVDWVKDNGEAVARVRRDAIAASDKPSCLVLDFVGNSGKHKLITAADILGGKYAQAVRDYARETQEAEGEPRAVDEALARAAAELALLEEEGVRREQVRARSAEYEAVEVSPFGHGGPRVAAASLPGEPATEKQVWRLVRRHGWSQRDARALTKRQASAIISRLIQRGDGE